MNIKIMFLFLLCLLTGAALKIHAQEKNTFTGADKFWRTRQAMAFYFNDRKGTGFKVDLLVRDMNVYHDGKRPAFVFVVAPDGKVVNQLFIPDDGITKSDFKYRDGVFDIGLDCRYREYRRKHGLKVKPRSPLLDDPEKIPARRFSLQIPAKGKGLYRLYIAASWDHWFSVIPSRDIVSGIYPGSGAMYCHKKQLSDTYIYVPEKVKDISFLLTEETEPFNWNLKVTDKHGKVVAAVCPKTFANFTVLRKAAGRQVLRLQLSGKGSGACLSIRGIPFILFPDAKSAEEIKSGLIDGEFFSPYQKIAVNWARSIPDEELKMNLQGKFPGKVLKFRLSNVAKILRGQNMDRTSEGYGKLKANRDIIQLISAWRTPGADNPFYKHSALLKRIILAIFTGRINYFGTNLSFNRSEKPFAAVKKPGLELMRSSWWSLADGRFITYLLPIEKDFKAAVPPAVQDAFNQILRQWTLSRYVMEQGLCTNQWAHCLRNVSAACKFTADPKMKKMLDFQVKRFCTSGNLGRGNPDNRSGNSDIGMINGGIPAELFGHDNEYALESCTSMAHIWEDFKYPEIVEWLKEYYVIKSHLTLSKTAKIPLSCFKDTCSPTDCNSRTRYYTHKSIIGNIHGLIPYGSLWRGKADSVKWPFMEKQSFVRNIADNFFFINTSTYYAVIYAGPPVPEYTTWDYPLKGDSSVEYIGFHGMGYGGYQYKSYKSGGISALYVKGAGPVLLGNNHNYQYANNLWAELEQAICAAATPSVNRYMVCAGSDKDKLQFDPTRKTFVRSGRLNYTPIRYQRRIIFTDKTIKVSLNISSDKDFEMKQFYESIPIFPDGRIISVDKQKIALPKALITASKKVSKDQRMWGYNSSIPVFNSKSLSLNTATGKGIEIKLNKKYKISFALPLKYRAQAATMSAVNIALPLKWRARKSFQLEYTIIINK